MRIFTVSPMYPNDQMPSFGCFVKELEARLKADFSVQYIHAIRYKSKDSKIIKSISYLNWIIRVFWVGFKGNYDIIHAHTVFPGGGVAWIVSCFRNKPLLVTVHGADICLVHSRHFVFQRLTKKVLGYADSIHAVSNYIKNQIVEFYPLSSQKIFVQSMGVDLSLFKPSRRLYQKTSEVNIVFIGNLIEKKGWKQACQTIEELLCRGVKCRLNIYGDGVDIFVVQSWIASHMLAQKIIIHGAKPRGSIVSALQSADLLLLPSKFDEAFSLVTAEALACGVFVVVSKKGALPELVDDIQGSFVVTNSENINDLADACQASLKFREKQSGNPILSLLNEKYSLSTLSHRIFSIYTKLLNR